MASPLRSRVIGKARLTALLRRLPRTMTAEIRAAIQIGAEDIKATAFTLVPERTGRLGGAIKIKYSRDRMTARIGVWDKDAFYAHMVEFGTKPGSRMNPDGSVQNHPGTSRQPFLLPAYYRHKKAAYRLIRAAVINSLQKASR
jgi:HK97 gp10 family phage protein